MRCTLFRKHILGPVQKDGFQYCSRCGQAFRAPCKHEWNLIAIMHKKYDWSYRLAYGNKEDSVENVYECQWCKEIRKELL